MDKDEQDRLSEIFTSLSLLLAEGYQDDSTITLMHQVRDIKLIVRAIEIATGL